MLDEFTAQVRRGKRRYIVTAFRGVDGPHVAQVASADGTGRARFAFPPSRRRGGKFGSSLAEVAVDQYVAWFRERARKRRAKELAEGFSRRSDQTAAK
ncbi:MAG: hypothetical protein E6R03_04815 [Hyphomicrobiaceae bacterium]|nr:MAG: hypothetical protein E6R03_04815 [Hyphomicrobiaceae bacterium]